MNIILKQLLIIGATFFIILWFQNCEDKKNNKERNTLQDKYKLPILVSAVVGLILNFKEIFNDNVQENVEIIISEVPSKIIQSKGLPSDMNQHIYTDMPDF
jgi:hypothetical protein